MQQQLMQQAAQGARDPAKMRAVSLLGSSLGRALGGAMGGEDKELAGIEAANANQKDLQGQVLSAEQGSSQSMFDLAKVLAAQNFGVAAKDMNAKALIKQKEELDQRAAKQTKAEDDLDVQAGLEQKRMEAQELQDRAFELGANFDDNPQFQAALQSGKASPNLVKLAEAELYKDPDKKPTLTNDGKLLVESGMTAGSDEFKAAITDIIAKKGTLRTVKSPMEQRQILTGYIQGDPQYKDAKEKLTMVDTALNLLPSVRAGGQKNTSLFERTVSEIYNSQTKAVSEIDRMIKKGSWGRGMQDWISNGFEGTPSAVTIDEYEQVLTIMDKAMRKTVNDVIDTQSGIYGDLMSGDNLEKSTNGLRMADQREGTGAVDESDNELGTAIATSRRPDGTISRNGKTYIIRGGKVYEAK